MDCSWTPASLEELGHDSLIVDQTVDPYTTGRSVVVMSINRNVIVPSCY